jgi:chemotaxis protein histidine kinase CheA
MSRLIFDLDGINDKALEITKAIVDRNEATGKIDSPDAGPLAVAAALSDFFEIAAALDQGAVFFETDELAEFAAHGLDLLDRLAYQLLVLEVMEHREDMALVFASIGIWLARRGAVLDNLEGIADGFGRITNGLNDQSELAEICRLMEEVAEAASDQVQMDGDRSNPYRPWRVLNLNAGIAATRSLDPQLMEHTFDNLGHRLPEDMPGFFADGRRQMLVQDVPDDVRDVINRYADRWPAAPAH